MVQETDEHVGDVPCRTQVSSDKRHVSTRTTTLLRMSRAVTEVTRWSFCICSLRQFRNQPEASLTGRVPLLHAKAQHWWAMVVCRVPRLLFCKGAQKRCQYGRIQERQHVHTKNLVTFGTGLLFHTIHPRRSLSKKQEHATRIGGPISQLQNACLLLSHTLSFQNI